MQSVGDLWLGRLRCARCILGRLWTLLHDAIQIGVSTSLAWWIFASDAAHFHSATVSLPENHKMSRVLPSGVTTHTSSYSSG